MTRATVSVMIRSRIINKKPPNSRGFLTFMTTGTMVNKIDLEPEVRKRFVGFSHTVRIILLFYRRAFTLSGRHDFGG